MEWWQITLILIGSVIVGVLCGIGMCYLIKYLRRAGALKAFIIGLVALLVVAGGAYAYTAMTITSEVQVLEAISIASVAGDGTFDLSTLTWDIGEIYPMGTASINITFDNVADGPITLTLTANPSSLDNGNLTFSFSNPVLDVEAGSTASVTLTAETTQSLAPGSYSTQISVER